MGSTTSHHSMETPANRNCTLSKFYILWKTVMATQPLTSPWTTCSRRRRCISTRLNATHVFAGIPAGRAVVELRERLPERRHVDHLSPPVVAFSSSLFLKTASRSVHFQPCCSGAYTAGDVCFFFTRTLNCWLFFNEQRVMLNDSTNFADMW